MQESCVINRRITKVFKLEKGSRQGDNIKSIKMFENPFLVSAYAGDSTFFLKDKNSVKELLNIINCFSSFFYGPKIKSV